LAALNIAFSVASPIAALCANGLHAVELAEKAGLRRQYRHAHRNDAKQSTVDRLQRAREAAGVEFTNGETIGAPGAPR